MRCIIKLAFLILLGGPLSAQVFPGDANQNGRADHEDVIFVGYAYGSSGPARLVMGTEFTEMPIALPWDAFFPNGTNYAHADANGDGQVSITDMLTIVSNYGLIHNTPLPTAYPPASPVTDPQLRLIPEPIGMPLTAGVAIDIAIQLDYPNTPPANINGLAFTIDFDKNYIQSISLSYDEDWLEGPGSSFRFQTIDPQQTSELDLASTRYGSNGTEPSSSVGMLSLVIEDDLITFMEEDSIEISLITNKIMLVDDALQLQPVNQDTLKLIVYHPSFLLTATRSTSPESFRCFPNPVQGRELTLLSGEAISAVRLYDINGRQVFRQNLAESREAIISIPHSLPLGLYLLQADESGGQIYEQLLMIP
jgi:hypothetical protein